MTSFRWVYTFLFFGICIASQAQDALTMKQSVQIARTNNPFLKTLHYNIAIAEADITTARLRPNLVLNNQSLQSVNSRYYPKGTETFNPINRQVWWQLTKPIRLPSQRKFRIEVAQQGVLLEQRNYSEAERNLANDVSNQWLNTWILQTRIGLFIEAQSNIDSLVKINEVRLRNLVITQTDLLRTKLIADQYKLQIRTLRQNYINELKRLKLLLGRADSVVLDAADVMEPIPAEKLSLDTLLAYAVAHRTDVKAAQSQIDLNQSNIQFQRSLAYPMPELGMIWNPQNTIPYLGFFGTVQIPIFSRNQGEINKSIISRQQSEQNLNTVKFSVVTEITTSYQAYKTDQQNLAKYQDILTQSETVLNSVRYAYLKGGTTIVDFLEAQRTWFETRQIYYDAVLTYRKSYLQLLYASGMINQLYE